MLPELITLTDFFDKKLIKSFPVPTALLTNSASYNFPPPNNRKVTMLRVWRFRQMFSVVPTVSWQRRKTSCNRRSRGELNDAHHGSEAV